MDNINVEKLANHLHQARKNKSGVEQLTKEYSNLSRPLAYQIQWEGISLRERDGEKVIGLKMGLTSEGKRKQMNLDAPLYGVLTDKMLISNNSNFSIKNLIHPKIEPEIAFKFKKDLKGLVTREEVLDACEEVYPCMEILDSRYEMFKYFSMEDVISDNSSSSHFILGKANKDFRNLDLINLNLKMFVNGQCAQEGTTKAISDDPVQSIIQLAHLLSESDRYIPKGSVVLAGAATAAVELKPGMQVELEMDNMEKTSIKIGEE